MSVDVRTRSDGPRSPVDAHAFFGGLPDRLDEHRAAMADGLRWMAPRPLAIEVPDGSVWRLRADDDRVTVVPGPGPGEGEGEVAAHVRLAPGQLEDLVDDQQTFMAWFSAGLLDQPLGRLEDLLDWWVVLRAAIDGTPMYAPGGVDFLDRRGEPLDLHQSFSADDDPDDVRHFLEQAGYLHLTGVFTDDQMAQVSRDMDRAAPTYRPGDGRSWWARTADGAERLVRMQGFDHHSSPTAALVEEPQFLAIGALPGDGHRFGVKRDADNRVEALVKPIGVVEGISDVPWHKDCSLGRHSYECCSMTVGISVTGADAASGQLRVVAGSHRALVWPAFVRRGTDLPQIDLPTRTGDVTVHLSCTLHMAQPPVERERRVLYTGFGLPARNPAAAAEARARLRTVREAAPVTVSQTPGHLSG
jgi:hypothetical protein